MKASKPTRQEAQPSSFRNRSGKPVLLAGPSHTENEIQLLETALQLKNVQETCVFKASIWNSFTRPYQPAGVGAVGLRWLKEVKKQTQLRTACEVYNAHQAEEALAFDVDILCLSGKTTINPFAVQEIADALRGTRTAVLANNPVMPDLNAWAGAFERLHQAGLTDLGAIHKGFATTDKALYHSHPKWEHLLQLQQELPELPVLVDASQIAGKRSLLYPVAQRAFELGADGLLLEAQHTPATGTGNRQQLMPQELNLLLHALETRASIPETTAFADQLDALYQQIGKLDDTLIELLFKRSALTSQVGNFGLGSSHAGVLQKHRLQEQLSSLLQPDKSELADTFKVYSQLQETAAVA